MTPVLSWKIWVRFTTFFCGLVFWLSRRVPRWVIPRTFPRRFQLIHRWKILGSKEHQCFDGRALAISTVSGYVFGLNAIWIWRGEWLQFLLIMFFCDCLFLPRSCGGKWSNLTSIGSVSKSGMQSFESCYVMVLNMFFFMCFFYLALGSSTCFGETPGSLTYLFWSTNMVFCCCEGGGGPSWLWDKKKEHFPLFKRIPFEVDVMFLWNLTALLRLSKTASAHPRRKHQKQCPWKLQKVCPCRPRMIHPCNMAIVAEAGGPPESGGWWQP